VRATVLDEKQGNPAHVYCYDDIFYVANDRLNGYTRLDPAAVAEKDTAEQIRRRAGFHQGGGNHITLAVNGHYGFAAWIDREGANKNRVDITALDPRGNKQIDSSFELPSGGIHGAIACQGKIFFAPSDGICWVSASHAPKIKPPFVAWQEG
jgi:catechol 2,3-dioxygenase-like lactoylglutathione lyase family enzyme